MKIRWRDTFTNTNSDLENVKKSILNKTGVSISYGKKIFEDKNYIVLEQNAFEKIPEHNDYIIIPKGCIIKKI